MLVHEQAFCSPFRSAKAHGAGAHDDTAQDDGGQDDAEERSAGK